jgi:catechol 2,3-dioxygenase-like lactoylglutathione lyase family enzyme
MKKLQPIQSAITFLYYREMEPISRFYEDVLGLELVEDQEWAKIYRLAGTSFVGVVAGERGFHQPQDKNAVLVTLVVSDVPGWYEHLKGKGVRLLSELQDRKDILIQCFFFQDPGGYTFEVQQFLRPDLIEVFHGSQDGRQR